MHEQSQATVGPGVADIGFFGQAVSSAFTCPNTEESILLGDMNTSGLGIDVTPCANSQLPLWTRAVCAGDVGATPALCC